MGQLYREITPKLADFIAAQPMFFVGTAPSGDTGHVNVSPKGMSGTFVVVGPQRVAYLDWGGSGVEGTAHMRQNGRVCLMFCSFARNPKILRLHGVGTPVMRGETRYDELLRLFSQAPDVHGARAIIDVAVTRVSDSCGFGVPRMSLDGDRTTLVDVNARRTDADIARRRLATNTHSIDGLPGVAGTAAQRRYRDLLDAEAAATQP